MPDASATPSSERTEKEELAELYDNPLERLQLIGATTTPSPRSSTSSTSGGRASGRCCRSSRAPLRSRGSTGSTRITAACWSRSRAFAATATTARAQARALWRLASGTLRQWWIALVVGAIGVAIGLLVSWFVVRGAALASRRIRLSVATPLVELWRTIGNCGQPPRDQSRRFAVVAIMLTLGVWIVLPLLVTLSLAQ